MKHMMLNAVLKLKLFKPSMCMKSLTQTLSYQMLKLIDLSTNP
ncbi:unnamed protein product [Paramecium primaurelia]|uniref:Uncharacterized protein n=1 Tax=Paramecium primaurelia TaxID=5886 RepID=A0A8S1MID9_PARPR|nr:unnamed protein product [Paramecium primaurelia]